jgi:hypothetical protein
MVHPFGEERAVVDVPDLPFMMIDGRIEKGKSPGVSPAFQEAMQALYGAARRKSLRLYCGTR